MSEINMSLLNEFIEESREYLDEMETLLLSLSGDLENTEILNDIFRTMHNIKGGSQLTGLEKVSRLSHRLEDLLDLLRQGSKQTSSEIVEILISGRDQIVQLINELEGSQEEISSVDEMVEQLSALIEGDAAVTAEIQISETPAPVVASKEAESINQVSASVIPVNEDNTDYTEENDQELFGIFIDHLQEQLNFLATQVALIDASLDKNDIISHSIDVVNGLRSSANYMGYSDLLHSYEAWLTTLDHVSHRSSEGETVSLDFMDEYFDEIVRSFPQISDPRLTSEAMGMGQIDDVTAAVFDAFNEENEESNIDDSEDTVAGPVVDSSVVNSEEMNSTEALSSPAKLEIPESDIRISMLGDFIDEAREYLDEMEALLLDLSNDLENKNILNDIFRVMHNIKGGSQLTGLGKVSVLSHRMEDLLDMLRQGQKNTSSSIVELLITGRDLIVQLINELEESQEEISSVDNMVIQLIAMMEGGDSAATASHNTQTISAPVIEGAELSVDYSEENDQELFGIFIEHLRAQVGNIVNEVNQFNDSPDKDECLVRCWEAVGSLQSSANYMDYQELSSLYDGWRNTVGQMMQLSTAGKPVSLDVMNGYVDKIVNIFPQIGDIRSTVGESRQENIPESVPKETKQAAYPVISEINHKQSEEEEKALFERLNNALESSLVQATKNERDTLNDVFDEIVTQGNAGPVNDPVVAKQQNKAAETVKQPVTENTADKTAASKQSISKQEASKKETKKTGKGNEKSIKKSIRVDAEKIDTLMNQVGELVVDRSYFFQLFNEMRELQSHLKDVVGIDQRDVKMIRAFTYKLSEAISGLGRTSNELQEGVMKMRMLPISHIFNRYPRLVHDLTINTDKKVNLVVRGEDTELDKMIVEEISDPLLHIIRNAIDHGMEGVDDRLKNGKPESCTLLLEAYQESNHIVIEVTDDGRGIDLNKVKAKAIEKGLYSENEIDRMSNRDLTQIILAPGFSTAEKITGTSGRGVGMDVVKRNIEKLNGMLEIESNVGKGTRMRLKIPLTLAIIHALMVRVGNDSFTIPLANVDETVRINKADTSIVENVEVIHLRGVALPIFRLSRLFNVKSDDESDKSFVVIVSAEGKRTGFVVDELMGQEEVVIKPLADYVQDKSGFSGATIVGDGNISLILDIYELVKMTARRQANHHRRQTEHMRKDLERRRNGEKETFDYH